MGRFVELSAWVANPLLLINPERLEKQLPAVDSLDDERAGRLPTRYATGIRQEADVQVQRAESGSLDLFVSLTPEVLAALHELWEEASRVPSTVFSHLPKGAKDILLIIIGDQFMRQIRGLQVNSQRRSVALPDFIARLREIMVRFDDKK